MFPRLFKDREKSLLEVEVERRRGEIQRLTGEYERAAKSQHMENERLREHIDAQWRVIKDLRDKVDEQRGQIWRLVREVERLSAGGAGRGVAGSRPD